MAAQRVRRNRGQTSDVLLYQSHIERGYNLKDYLSAFLAARRASFARQCYSSGARTEAVPEVPKESFGTSGTSKSKVPGEDSLSLHKYLEQDSYELMERAAIMEFDGGLIRSEAERLAQLELEEIPF